MSEHVYGCYFNNRMQPQRDDVCVRQGGACKELPFVTFEEFKAAIADVEEKIVGAAMEGMNKAEWLCTECGTTGVGISKYTYHTHLGRLAAEIIYAQAQKLW